MKNSYLYSALAILTIGISGTVIHAYLLPEDVFNVDIPTEQCCIYTVDAKRIRKK